MSTSLDIDRPVLPAARRTPEVTRQITEFHKDFVDEVRAAVETHPVVVVGMKQNPVVKKARTALAAAGVPFHYIEEGSYVSGWKRRLAVKLWSGYPTFPQVFVKGTLVGGFRELVPLIQQGALPKQ